MNGDSGYRSTKMHRSNANHYTVERAGASIIGLVAIAFVIVQGAVAQSAQALQQPLLRWDGEGDSPDNPGPFATDISPKIERKAVEKAVRKVADWQLDHAEAEFSQDWTFGALYTGYIAAGKALHEPRYEAAMMRVGEKFHWELGPRLIDPNYVGHGQAKGLTYDANNQALAQTYIELYESRHDDAMIGPTRQRFDSMKSDPDNPEAPTWWWCDALFMAPAAWVRLYKVTGDAAYLKYMDQHWWDTSARLYDPQEHLYFRDSNFFIKREENGAKLFWSRGNGWVMAGVVRVLQDLPADYPTRPKYIEQYREMAARIASLQGKDGLWRPGLLDAAAYHEPELSGSGFFLYALAWGVNHGVLNRKSYQPVIEAGWRGMISHIYADGRLGSIQPVASGPGDFKISSSYVYGVGAFLLAGSEIYGLAAQEDVQHHHAGQK